VQGAGEFVGFLATPADFGRPGDGDGVAIVAVPYAGEAFAETL